MSNSALEADSFVPRIGTPLLTLSTLRFVKVPPDLRTEDLSTLEPIVGSEETLQFCQMLTLDEEQSSGRGRSSQR